MGVEIGDQRALYLLAISRHAPSALMRSATSPGRGIQGRLPETGRRAIAGARLVAPKGRERSTSGPERRPALARRTTTQYSLTLCLKASFRGELMAPRIKLFGTLAGP